ncbi:MAG: chitobiase/beta-hexosaminidase C-terminal domain-containing protein [Planctomycetota bacterium]
MHTLPRLPASYVHLLGVLALALSLACTGLSASEWDFRSSSYLGAGTSADEVRGVGIQSGGIIVLVANLPSYTPPGVEAVVLGAADESSQGMVLRLSPDGQSLLSVTRLADRLVDLAIDADDNLHIAAWDQGFYKLDPAAESVIWHKDVSNVARCDVGSDGISAALVTTETDPDSETPRSDMWVYDSDPIGSQLIRITGHRNTLDVAIDSATQTICSIGWRQASAYDGDSTKPVQISYIRGHGYDGIVKYTGYDWSTDRNADDFLNKPTNNMADSRGKRCSIGADGRLYAAFEVAGGNHMFRYDPFDIMTSVRIEKGDAWHDWHNTRSEHKTFFARYEPDTGAYLAGQQFCARLNSGGGNTLRPQEITADAQGRVYLVGDSAAHLPIPDRYTPKAGEVAVNPIQEDYTSDYEGGAFILVMSADLKTRLFCTRTCRGRTYGVGVRQLSDGLAFAWGGTADIKDAGGDDNRIHYTLNAIQSNKGGGDADGFFTVVAPAMERALAPQISPAAGTYVGSVRVRLASAPAGASIRYTLDGSDPDGSSPLYEGPLTINSPGNTTLRAKAFHASLPASAIVEAVYTIEADTTPPRLVSATGQNADSIYLQFDEVLDQASATDTAHYSVDNGIGVHAATLSADGRGVTLTIDAMLSGTHYTVRVSDVTDAAEPPNTIATGTSASFTWIEYTIQINFQPAGSDVPDGYLVDAGAAFADRGNGHSYGWNADNTDSARDRSGSGDPVWGTLNHMQRNGDFTWEIALENGSYYLHLGAWDPEWTESHAIAAEGTVVLEGDTAVSGALEVKGEQVEVDDGRLTLSNPSAETFNKINFIRIAPATAPDPIERAVRIEATVDLQIEVDQGAATISPMANGYLIDDVDGLRHLRITLIGSGDG